MQTEQLPPPLPHDTPRAPDAAVDGSPTAPAMRFPTLSAAGWLAATGATLLLIASIVVVASQWQTITPEIRFSGLVAALLAVYFVAEAGRPRYPSTAQALATLAATMTAPVGVAAAASLSQTWPVCVLAGGVTALVAAEVQSRRWNVSILKAATVAATGMAAAGLAALTGTPVALLVAAAAAAAFAVGAWRRGVVLSVAVGCAPGLLALSEAGIGTGTLARIGATGDALSWSAPLSAAIAAAVIGIIAHRRNEIGLVAPAAATLTSGVLLGLTHADVGAIALWTLPAVVVLAVEAIAAVGTRSVWGDATNRFAPWVAVPVTLGGLVAPLLAFGGRFGAEFGGGSVDHGWAFPLALTAVALAVATAGAIRRSSRPWRIVGTYAGASGAAFGAVVMTGTSAFGWAEVATLACIAAATALVGSTQGRGWMHSSAVLAVIAGGSALGVAGLSFDQSALLLAACTIALTGLAFLRGEFTPLDTAALATSTLLVLVAQSASPVVVSLAWIAASGQWLMYSIAQRHRIRGLLSGGVFVLSVVSLWWSTGTNDLFIDQIERFGADGADVAMGVASLALLVAGALLRRFQPASSWLAYSPGLGMATAWLLEAQTDAHTAWATFAALGIGVLATGIGGFRRLGAPLVIGTVMIGGTVLISAGPRLADAPTWIWIATGGIGLLVLAAAVERSSRPLIGTGRDGSEISLVDQFRRDFS